MQREGKVWGETSLLWKLGDALEIHKIRVKPGGFSSWHRHDFKWNAFIVHEGEITIEIKKEAYPLTDRTILKAGDFTTVRPREMHRFVAMESPAVVFEIYCPMPLSEDIVRADVGGLDERFACASGSIPSS